jgi:hypothetical protein
MEEKEPKEASTSLFRLVRGKAQRFMTMVTDETAPTPMDWMFDARSYGLKIR